MVLVVEDPSGAWPPYLPGRWSLIKGPRPSAAASRMRKKPQPLISPVWAAAWHCQKWIMSSATTPSGASTTGIFLLGDRAKLARAFPFWSARSNLILARATQWLSGLT